MSQIKNERDGNIENMQESLMPSMISKTKCLKTSRPPTNLSNYYLLSIPVPLFVTFAGPS